MRASLLVKAAVGLIMTAGIWMLVHPADCTDHDGDGFSECTGDCDDTNPAIHPGAVEICNHLDDNCDGRIDEGNGFDPGDVPDPTAVENIERPCGRGLMLMRHYMNEVSFNGPGNSVRMAKVLRNGKK